MALSDNLEMLYHFNELAGTNVADSSGNGRDATAVGATIDSINQKLGVACRDWDGINDQIDSVDLDLPVNNRGYLGWSKKGLHGVFQVMLSKTDGSSQGEFDFVWNGDDKIRIQIRDGVGAVKGSLKGATAITDSDWHMWGVWYDGVNLKLFLDGNLDAIAAYSGDFVLNNESYVMGKRQLIGQPRWYTGKSDEMAFYSVAPSDGGVTTVGNAAGGDVAAFWNGGAGIEIAEAAIKSFKRLGKGLNKGLARGL